MTNKILLEEINRFKLLSGYSSKKTLTENQTELDEVMGGALKGLTIAGKEAGELGSELKTLFGGAQKLIQDFKLTNIRDVKVFENLLSKDLKSLEKELVKATQDDLKSGIAPINDTRSLAKDISKIIAIRRIIDEQSALAKKWLADVNTANGKNWASVEEAIGGLKTLNKPVKIPKVKPNRIKQISDEVKSSALQRVGEVKPKAPKGTGGKGAEGVKVTETSTNVIINVENEVEIQAQQLVKLLEREGGKGTWINWLKGKSNWGKIWPYLAAAGVGAGIYGLLSWLFTKNGKQYFPDCISGKVLMDPKALEKTAKQGLPTNMVYMNDPGNPEINGALFTSDGVGSKTGSVTLPNGSTGKYVHTGDQIKIDAGGNVIVFDCSQTLIIQGGDKEPAPAPVPGGGCTQSSDFPFAFYQMNSMVGQVQNCVGARADNCMGPQTAGKIQQFLGLSETPSSLTKDIYDKVMAKCGGKTPSPDTKPIKEPTQTSGGVTGGGEKPSSEEDFEF